MGKKILIVSIVVLIIAIIAVAVALLNLKNNGDTTNTNTLIQGNSTTIEEAQENIQNTEVQTQNITTENNVATENSMTTQNLPVENTTSNNQKVLIAFFSRADENYSVGTVEVGNTEIMAGFIKDYLGEKADTFKIDPVKAYPTNYKECTEVATQEKNSNARPEFKNPESLDLSKYDTILLGYPIWWGDVPMIINTFLEKYDFTGKTIIPFNTHEGSGESGTFNSIKNKMTSSTVNTNGLTIRGTEARKESSRSTVENWLKGLGY